MTPRSRPTRSRSRPRRRCGSFRWTTIITSASFELNNALNVSQVVDDQGKQIPASRNQQDFTVRLSFDQPLPKGQPVTVTFYYDGKLTGQEDSPVYGIKFAAIHPDSAYLMYPGALVPGERLHHRPVRRRLCASPCRRAIRCWAAAWIRTRPPAIRTPDSIKFDKPSFPGSIAVVKEQPAQGAVGRRHHGPVFPRSRRPRWRSRTARKPAR